MPPKRPGKRSRSKSTKGAKSAKRAKSAAKKPHHDVHFDMQQMHDTLQDQFDGTVDPNATIFFLGVMQYVASELLEVSGTISRGDSKGKPYVIKQEDILKALEADEELAQLFGGLYEEEPSNSKKKKE